MACTRRDLIILAGLAPLAPTLTAGQSTAQASLDAAAPALRPVARGTSARVCARCGARGHTALDLSCPDALAGSAARQTAAREATRETAWPERVSPSATAGPPADKSAGDQARLPSSGDGPPAKRLATDGVATGGRHARADA